MLDVKSMTIKELINTIELLNSELKIRQENEKGKGRSFKSNENESELSEKELRYIIDEYLLEQGIPRTLKGYQYLITGIYMCITDMSNISHITKLYEDIASQFEGSSGPKVERAIRHCLEFVHSITKNSKFLADSTYEIKRRLRMNI